MEAGRPNTRKIVHIALFILCLLLLAGHISWSCAAGYPIGLGGVLARSHVKDYCMVIYPNAKLGRTGYNLHSNSFYTEVTAGGETFGIQSNPISSTVRDDRRADALFGELELQKIISEWNASMDDVYCIYFMNWPYEDPHTPIGEIYFHYNDSGSEMPSTETEMKEMLFPVVSACCDDLKGLVPINQIRISYYHPDFDPEEASPTWQVMQVYVDDYASFNIEMLLDADVIVK